MSKFDSLKPILNLLETMFVKEGLTQHQADLLVLDIAERLVTAGYGWDKILQYQSKVRNILFTLYHMDQDFIISDMKRSGQSYHS